MFSGLIEHTGVVVANAEESGGRRLVIEAPNAIKDGIEPKDSIAVNGVCLTATDVKKKRVAFDVVPETLARTTLGMLLEGERVNLELSLRLGDRLGGHFVYGHVDAMTQVLAHTPEGLGERLVIATPPGLRRFIVEKGYVALDGVSLTVAGVADGSFTVALIPETAARTTLGSRQAGQRINLEVDPLARYALSGNG